VDTAVADTGVDTAVADSGVDAGATGACTNAADEAITDSAAFATDTEGCGMGCFLDPNKAACVATCVLKTGVSQACADCFGSHVACAIDNCLQECFDSSSAGCVDCLASGCDPAFTECSGITP
jgi:hypothetical protein